MSSIIIVLRQRRFQLERLEASAVGAGELSGIRRVDAHAGVPEDAVERVFIDAVGLRQIHRFTGQRKLPLDALQGC